MPGEGTKAQLGRGIRKGNQLAYERSAVASVHDHIIVGKNGHASMKGLRLVDLTLSAA
jgi:hypothetical protein